MFRNVHPETHMYETAINVKEESLDLKEQGKICGKLWREKREWKNNVIIL